MDKRIASALLLCFIGVIVSPSVLAGVSSSRMDPRQAEQIRAEAVEAERARVANTGVIIHTRQAERQMRCLLCEQVKLDVYFSHSLQWQCNRVPQKHHFICNNCINPTKTCDYCINEDLERHREHQFANPYAPGGATPVVIEPVQTQVPSIEPVGVLYSPMPSQVASALRADSVPVPAAIEVFEEEQMVIYFQRMGSTKLLPIKIARKVVEEGWTIANLKSKVYDVTEYHGPFILFGQLFADDVLLSDLPKQLINGTILQEKRVLLGGEVLDLELEVCSE